MPMRCILCTNIQPLDRESGKFSFFRFPTNFRRQRMWVEIIKGSTGYTAKPKRDRICDQHFKSEDIEWSGACPKLSLNAIPVIEKEKNLQQPDYMDISENLNQVIKCRAAVAWAPKTPLSIEEVEVAPPKAGEVRVKMTATGVCHTDYSFLNNIFVRGVRFPIILGHEGAGIVESVGEGVTKFKPGDHVIPLYVPQCFECRVCKGNKTNLCEKIVKTQQQCVMPDGTSRFSCKGKTVYHSMGTSTFSEYTVVADVSLAKIDSKAPLEKVCLIGCGISTGYGAVQQAAKVEPGSICGVWGLGGIGLSAVMGCRNAGASRVFGIDINPSKREIAEKFGCTDFINPLDYPDQKLEDVLMEKTGGGFDYTFECIGNINCMKTAFYSSNPSWGLNILIGISSFEKELGVFPLDVICGRTLKGTYFGSYRGVESVPKLVQEYMENKIFVDELISHTMTLDDINDALKYMETGESIRSVVHF